MIQLNPFLPKFTDLNSEINQDTDRNHQSLLKISMWLCKLKSEHMTSTQIKLLLHWSLIKVWWWLIALIMTNNKDNSSMLSLFQSINTLNKTKVLVLPIMKLKASPNSNRWWESLIHWLRCSNRVHKPSKSGQLLFVIYQMPMCSTKENHSTFWTKSKFRRQS